VGLCLFDQVGVAIPLSPRNQRSHFGAKRWLPNPERYGQRLHDANHVRYPVIMYGLVNNHMAHRGTNLTRVKGHPPAHVGLKRRAVRVIAHDRGGLAAKLQHAGHNILDRSRRDGMAVLTDPVNMIRLTSG